jgi:hypothetical protein
VKASRGWERSPYDTRLTIWLDGEPTGPTTLSLVHEDLDELAAAMPEVAENIRPGLEDVLDNLIVLIAADDGAKANKETVDNHKTGGRRSE